MIWERGMSSPDEWLSLSDVADLLGVHPSTVRNWSDQHRLPVHRTGGGHRRYRRADVELWLQAHQASAPADAGEAVQSALRRTRMQISEGALEQEPWYQKLDAEARELYRRSGRALLQGLMSYLASDGHSAAAEARSQGYEYASRARSFNLTAVEAMRAFMFFRNNLLESMMSTYEGAAISSPVLWGEMLRKMTAFTDQVMMTLLETYEAYERNSRERQSK